MVGGGESVAGDWSTGDSLPKSMVFASGAWESSTISIIDSVVAKLDPPVCLPAPDAPLWTASLFAGSWLAMIDVD
jgi:hypothetical protein